MDKYTVKLRKEIYEAVLAHAESLNRLGKSKITIEEDVNIILKNALLVHY